jgi:hypothetical protein
MTPGIQITHACFTEQKWCQANLYTCDASKVINDALERAIARGAFGRPPASFVLWAILRWEMKLGLAALEACGVDGGSLERDVELELNTDPMEFDPMELNCESLERIAVAACDEARSMGIDGVCTEHLIMAMLKSEDPGLRRVFEKYRVGYDLYKTKVHEIYTAPMPDE